METQHQRAPSTPGPVTYLKELIEVLRPWVYFLWVPALAYPGILYTHTHGTPLPWTLYALCFTGIFSAMCTQHFFHVAGGSTSTIETHIPKQALAAFGFIAAAPLLAIVAVFAILRGLAVVALFVAAGACLVGYAVPHVKTEWYWGIGNALVAVGTYYVLTGGFTAGLIAGATAIACLYYNMLHSARLAEGDYADADGKAEKGYYTQRYAFFIGATLLPLSFVL
jgi:hypothetical protein